MSAQRSSKPKKGAKELPLAISHEVKKSSKMVVRTATEEDYSKRGYDTIGTFLRFENGKLKS